MSSIIDSMACLPDSSLVFSASTTVFNKWGMTSVYWRTISESSILVKKAVVAFKAATYTYVSLSVRDLANICMKASLCCISC